MKPDYISSTFSVLLEKKGLKRIRFHDLRHSCASFLLANGVPMKQIQEWLGHSDFNTTANIYGKVTGTTEITDEPIVLKLTKMNTFTGKPFAGIEFVLKDAEGNAVKTAMTNDGYRVVSEDGEESFKVDENGYAEFRYLKAGEYTGK